MPRIDLQKTFEREVTKKRAALEEAFSKPRDILLKIVKELNDTDVAISVCELSDLTSPIGDNPEPSYECRIQGVPHLLKIALYARDSWAITVTKPSIVETIISPLKSTKWFATLGSSPNKSAKKFEAEKMAFTMALLDRAAEVCAQRNFIQNIPAPVRAASAKRTTRK